MNKYILHIILLLCYADLMGQGLAHSMNTNANLSLYNPAFNGVQGDLIYHMHSRVQWMNFRGAPFTNVVHFEKRLDFNKRMALGVRILDDRWAVLSNTGFHLDFNYKKPLRRKHFLGIGFGFQLNSQSYKRSKLEASDVDPVLAQGDLTFIQPNLSFGLLYSTKISYFSLSVPKVFMGERIEQIPFGEPMYENLPVSFTYGMQIDMYRYAYVPQLSLRYLPISGQQVPISFDLSLEYFKYGEYTMGAGMSSAKEVLVHYGYKISKTKWLKYSIGIPLMNSSVFGPSHELTLRGIINEEGFSYISGESWFKAKQRNKYKR